MSQAVPSQIIYTTRVGSTEIALVESDMIALRVDAIVCYASTSLTLHSHLARQLVSSGGAFIRAESSKHAPAQVGDVIALPAGKLPSRHLLVAVTNQLRTMPSLESISACATALAETADQLGLGSLAIPLLRVGRALAPADILRALLAPLFDHCSGGTSLARLLIVVQPDRAADGMAEVAPCALHSVADLADLGRLRAQAAALRHIEGRLTETLALGADAVDQLRSRQIDMQGQIATALQRALADGPPGQAAIELELRRCQAEHSRLSSSWLERAVNG